MARYTVHVKIKHDHLGDGPSDLVVTMRGDKKILQDVENYALHYEEMSKSLATAEAECAIYYEIAASAIGEEQTIALRDAAMRRRRNGRWTVEKIERCFQCDEPTGRAGPSDDSIYINDIGPFCERCYHELVDIVMHDNAYYRAADVDALLADVQRLVEASRRSKESMYAMNGRTHPMDSATKFIQMHNLLMSADELEKAIAAVERHFESNKNTQIKGIDNQK